LRGQPDRKVGLFVIKLSRRRSGGLWTQKP